MLDTSVMKRVSWSAGSRGFYLIAGVAQSMFGVVSGAGARRRRREDNAGSAHQRSHDDEDAEYAPCRHQLRSSSRRTMAARNSAIPAPEREDVVRISGKAAGCFANEAFTSATRCSSSADLT